MMSWPLVQSVALLAAIWAASTITIRIMTSRFPGPRLLKSTQLPLLYQEFTASREAFTEALHRKYGPLVQVAPRHISVNDVAGLREISAVSKRLDRPDPLPAFHNYGEENLVSAVSGDVHQERRKPIRSIYSARAAESEALTRVIMSSAECMLALAKEEGKGHDIGNVVEVKEMLRSALYDVMSFVAYGPKNQLNLVGDATQRTAMRNDTSFQDMRMESISGAVMFLLPKLTLWLRKMGLAWRDIDGTTPPTLFSDSLGRKALETVKLEYQEGDTKGDEEYESLMNRLYAHFHANGPTPAVPSEQYILSDSLDHFWAGVSTTADGLSPLIRRLSLPENQGRQNRLRKELEHAVAEAGLARASELPSEKLKKLPFLNAVIRETLRLHPPIPFSMERLVVDKQGLLVHGYHIPSGWRVSAPVMQMQKHEDVFAEARDWVPERWVDSVGLENEEKGVSREMKNHFLAFGIGPRMCLGMNVAWSIMRGFVAVTYGEVKTTLEIKHNSEKAKENEAAPDGVAGWLEERKKKVWIRIE